MAQAGEPRRNKVEIPNTLNDPFIMARLHLGGGFTSASSVLRWAPGVGVFFGRGLGLSLEVDHTAVLFRESFTVEHPGVADAVPVHIVRSSAAFEWIMMPLEDFSPYFRFGMGPMIHSGSNAAGRRMLGYWETGLGIIFYLDGFFIDIGAMVNSRFGDDRHRAIWTYQEADLACGWSQSPCSFRVEPRIGLNYAFAWKGPRREPR
jgi:hypothetical protein